MRLIQASSTSYLDFDTVVFILHDVLNTRYRIYLTTGLVVEINTAPFYAAFGALITQEL